LHFYNKVLSCCAAATVFSEERSAPLAHNVLLFAPLATNNLFGTEYGEEDTGGYFRLLPFRETNRIRFFLTPGQGRICFDGVSAKRRRHIPYSPSVPDEALQMCNAAEFPNFLFLRRRV